MNEDVAARGVKYLRNPNTNDSLAQVVLQIVYFLSDKWGDLEISYEIHQSKYKIMIECNMDWPPWWPTHIIYSCYEEW